MISVKIGNLKVTSDFNSGRLRDELTYKEHMFLKRLKKMLHFTWQSCT